MHKCKSPSEQSLRPLGLLRKAGFSLIEVSMALAIVAVAFVALIGLLPAGMKIFEAAVATTAETRMLSHLSGVVQASDYTDFRKGNYDGVYFYFDVDGLYLDSSQKPVPDFAVKRVYAAKLILGDQNIPNSAGTGNADYDDEKTSMRVLVAMGRADPVVIATMDKLQKPADVKDKEKISPRVKVQPLLFSRMDLEVD
jgi:uncharacterized protein (TIGR02598 family)